MSRQIFPPDSHSLRDRLYQVFDLKTLKEAFTSIVPQLCGFNTKEVERRMPFPPSTVEEITEDDINALAKCFDLPTGLQFSSWGHHYYDINRLFKKQQARDLIRAIQDAGLPLDRTVLLVTKAMVKELEGRARFFWARGTKKGIQASEKEDHPIKKAIAVLLDFIAQAEVSQAVPSLAQDVIRSWENKDRLRGLLAELQQHIDREYGEAETRANHSPARKRRPNRAEDRPYAFYLAWEGVKELADEVGSAERGAEVARKIFRVVEIEVNPETARKQLRRYRDKPNKSLR